MIIAIISVHPIINKLVQNDFPYTNIGTMSQNEKAT